MRHLSGQCQPSFNTNLYCVVTYLIHKASFRPVSTIIQHESVLRGYLFDPWGIFQVSVNHHSAQTCTVWLPIWSIRHPSGQCQLLFSTNLYCVVTYLIHEASFRSVSAIIQHKPVLCGYLFDPLRHPSGQCQLLFSTNLYCVVTYLIHKASFRPVSTII